LSLLLDRYVGYSFDRKPWQFQEEQKAELYKNIASQFNFNTGLIDANYQRWQAIVETLPHHKSFTASPEWRMVVGLGQASILETSMTLDRITGIPIIPGSALKGLAASYAMLCDLEETERTKAEENPIFQAVFGTQDQTGKVIFLDSVPTKSPKLEPDIMNNHYQQYYNGESPPTPYQSPVPVYFLTLGRKSQFAFAVAGRDRKPETEELVKKAHDWLKEGLSTLGVGAKTAAGYGYLEIKE
jgi:CRISPR-associated protein Cmr6